MNGVDKPLGRVMLWGDVVGCAILLHQNSTNGTGTNGSSNNNNATASTGTGTSNQQQQAQQQTGQQQKQQQSQSTDPLDQSGNKDGVLSTKNEIRFFLNGECLGQFILSKGNGIVLSCREL
jgi:hypothetical protein